MPNTNYDRTVNIVRNAIPRMSKFRIPITPSNYAVWYEYLTESNCWFSDYLTSRFSDYSLALIV